MFLPAGYVKLEGATVNRSNYPRLVALADTYSLWTSDTASNPGLFGEGDGSTTMILPNWTGRMAQFAATAGGKVDAGLLNITGYFATFCFNSSVAICAGNGRTFKNTTASTGNAANIQTSGTTGNYIHVNFDASNANSIYGNSHTVQPPAINVFAIMRY